MDELLTIGEVAARTGVATSALRFYEDRGLIGSQRSTGNQRRYPRSVIRVVSVIRAGQALGLPLREIGAALAKLPPGRAPTRSDWGRISRSWGVELDRHIAALQQLRRELDGCIGCGCLSLRTCGILNPDDRAGEAGSGPRYLLGDSPRPG